METSTKWDDDVIVDTDTDQGANNEESEGKHQREESKKDYLESDQRETDEWYHRENIELVIRKETPPKGDDNDLVDTDTDRETNNEEPEEIYRI